MSSSRYFRILDALDDFAARPPLSPRASRPAAKELGRALRTDVKRLRGRTEHAAVAAPGDREAALHDVRKAVRRLRNSVDAVRPEAAGVLGPRRRRILGRISAAAKPIEKSLGDRHDLVLFAEQLEIAARGANEAGEETFVYGMLTERSARSLGAVPSALDSSVRRIRGLARKF